MLRIRRIMLAVIITALLLSAACQETRQTATDQSAPRVRIRGWNILSDNRAKALAAVDAAPAYDINHLQISHNIIHDLCEAREPRRRDLANELIHRAHERGIPEVVVWDHALYKLDYYPERFRTGPGGKIDLDNPDFWAWLRQDYRDMLDLLPDIDGTVLTFIETGAHVEDQHSQTMTTEEEKLARVIDEIAEVVIRERGLKLYVRTFIYTRAELDSILKCLALVQNRDIIVMVKEVPHDFFLTHPLQTYILRIDRPIIIEFDAAHEYSGQGVIANTFPDLIRRRWTHYLPMPNVVGYVARTDRRGDTSIIGRPSEINLYALKRLSEDPALSADQILNEFITRRYGKEALAHVKPAFEKAYDIVLAGVYTLGLNTSNHSSFEFDRLSTYSRHVSGRWMDEPYITIAHGVNKRFHYYRDIVNHLSPAEFKRPNARTFREDPFLTGTGWLTPEENITLEYLRYIVTEKDFAVEQARRALASIEQARPYVSEADYNDLFLTLYRTLLTVKLRRGGAKAYYGYRLFCRGEEYRTPELHEIVRSGLEEIRLTALLIERDFRPYPRGGWDWKKDARDAMELHEKVLTGWDKFGGIPFPLNAQ